MSERIYVYVYGIKERTYRIYRRYITIYKIRLNYNNA